MSRAAQGLYVFQGRYELQSRAYARAHGTATYTSSANADRGPAAIRRDLRNLRTSTFLDVDLEDFHPPVPRADQPPVAKPAPLSGDGKTPDRSWHRPTPMLQRHSYGPG